MTSAVVVLRAEPEVAEGGPDLVALVVDTASLCHAISMGVPLSGMPRLVERAQYLVARMEHPSLHYRQEWLQASPCNVLGMAISALAGDTERIGEAAQCLRAFAIRLQKVSL